MAATRRRALDVLGRTVARRLPALAGLGAERFATTWPRVLQV
jgi:hypothetical protein